MTEYLFQQLTAFDVTAFRALLRVFGEAFEDVETYQGAVPPDNYLRSFLALPHVITVIVRQGNAVVGGLVAYEMIKFERERREIYIYDLAVAQSHRRRRVATNLIAELKRIARQRGAYVIFVQADRGDAPAVALYESVGVREDVHHFDILVNGGHQ
jgi:aminoglycoside 3-N-acetyltransferase I